MTFLLRATLVIGALSYFALVRGGPGVSSEATDLARRLPAYGGTLPRTVAAALPAAQAALPALESLPPELRGRLAREGLAALTRRVSAEPPPVAEPPSRDTLAETDRAPSWRGVEAR